MKKCEVIELCGATTQDRLEEMVQVLGKTRRERQHVRALLHVLLADDLALEQGQRKPQCGARTRAGHPCRRKGTGRGGRCASHGGRSTGPRTPEGKARIAEAQHNRWAIWRASKNAEAK